MTTETDISEYLTVAVRGWTGDRKKPGKHKVPIRNYAPARMLVIDTETLTDTTQALTFGSAQLVHVKWRYNKNGTHTYIDRHVELEVLFHADDLETTDPDGYATLIEYGKTRDVSVVSRAEFMERYFYYHCVPHKSPSGRKLGTATAVFFNAPFDISRLAEDFGYGRGRNKGAFSFRMWPEYEGSDNRFRPRIIIRHIDSKKALIYYSGKQVAKNDVTDSDTWAEIGHGQFLDLRTLIWGMTNNAVSLARACELFGLSDEYRKTQPNAHGQITAEYIDYNRQDVTATRELAVKVLTEYFHHPIDVQPSKIYSSASIAKAYLRTMGIAPMFERPGFINDPVMLGNSISTFYGGRAECHIRRTPVPVQVCDFTSMYPTVNTLMGLWNYITADELSTVDATDQVRELASTVTVERLLDPDVWPSFVGMAQILPDGDTLPARANYTDTPGDYGVGLNRLHSSTPLWYTIPDVLASALLTGRAPRILRAVRFVASEVKLSSLRPVSLMNMVYVDPTKDDFFKVVVERRQAIKKERTGTHPDGHACQACKTMGLLKVLANAGSYGIFVEMLRDDLDKARQFTVYGAYDEPWQSTTKAKEEAQEFCYPPIGATITGAARLMLAILERLVTDIGGTWLFCDTDSMAIVANADASLVPCNGGPHVIPSMGNGPDGQEAVRALSYDQVDEIRATLNKLNPYDRNKVPDILKKEATCYGYGISAKRYTLFVYDETGQPIVPDQIDGKDAYSRHGLGMYLNPIDPESEDHNWMRQQWQYILDVEHGQRPEPLPWFTSPALAQVPISSPHTMRALETLNAGKPYAQQVKPFNFTLMAVEFLYRWERRTPGSRNRRFIAPYSTDPKDWESPNWMWQDIYDPDSNPIPGSEFKFHRMWGVVGGYSSHPEKKSLGPDGRPCTGRTVGLLQRRTVRVRRLTHIGKETNRLEDQQNGLYDRWSDFLTEYPRADLDPVASVVDAYQRREFASLVNAESAASQSTLDECVRAWRQSPGKDYQHLTGKDLATALDAGTTSIIREHGHYYGEPVRVDHRIIETFMRGGRVSEPKRRAIIRTAAKLVAPTVGIKPENVKSKLSIGGVPPETVLALWRDAGQPSPVTRALCVCGCGEEAADGSQYFNATCRRRYNRTRRSTGEIP